MYTVYVENDIATPY